MNGHEKDPRPKRKSYNDMPCLADPNLMCVDRCRMFDLKARKEALKAVDLELPPVNEILSHHVDLNDPGAQEKEERHYYDRQKELLKSICDFE